MFSKILFSIAFTLCLTIPFQLAAQDDVQLETNLTLAGTITVSQDETQTPVRGMIRFDTITHTFQGYDGAVWIDFGASGAAVNNRTDTLKIGDSHGGGIVFHTAGPHGLVVTTFDLSDPINVLDEEIPWGDTGATDATSQILGERNTADIIAFLQDWTDADGGSYAAKICDELDLGGHTDWYLPSLTEFMLMNQNVGTEAPAPNNNIVNLSSTIYWTSTELSVINAHFYRTSSGQGPGNLAKSADLSVRAIRSY